jgi:hypothetical protein
MPPKILLLGITILSVVIIVGGVAYTLAQNKPAVSPSSSGSGEQTPTGGTTSEVQPQYPDDSSSGTSAGANNTDLTLSTTASPYEQVRDQGMTFLKNSKKETAALMANLSWTGGRDDLAPIGTERYYYYSSNSAWSVTVETSGNSTFTYIITGTYNSATMTVSFTEAYTNGVIQITSYSSQRYPTSVQP